MVTRLFYYQKIMSKDIFSSLLAFSHTNVSFYKNKQKPSSAIRYFLLFITLIIGQYFCSNVYAQKTMWVGESYTCDASSSILGLTSDVSWSTSGGYLSLSGSGFYRNVTVTQYFSGSATITCSWKYRLYSGDRWHTQSRSWSISCYENPVSISPSNLTLAPGEQASVHYSYRFSNSYTSYGNAYFSSSNPSVATVSSSGAVYAKKPGTAYINVYSKISSASNAPYCTVIVKEKVPTSVSLQGTLTLFVGETKTLTPTVSPSDVSTAYSWSSDDSNIAKVNSYGAVTGVKSGTTRIRVTTTSGGCTDYCNVTVKDLTPTGVSLPSSLTLIVGENKTLEPTVTPSGAVTSYTWNSENNDVATITSSGIVKGLKPGTTRVKVTTTVGGYSDYCNITVKNAPVLPTKVTLQSQLKLYQGFTYTLTPVLEPSNAETICSWKSSNTTVASVSSTGKITAKKAGTAKITITTKNNLNATCEVTVMPLPANLNADAIDKKLKLLNTLIKTTLNKTYQ